ncbi:MAG: hypothetical protein KC547_18245, partial [Anaerolineae bacterium]|nr:hypothetical protein [Anaerolineae bacterium]
RLPFPAGSGLTPALTRRGSVCAVGDSSRHLKQGCRRVILVYAKRIVEVLTPDDRQLLTVDDTLTGSNVLPGFSVAVAKLFPKLEGE